MMGGLGGPRQLLEAESSKPKQLGATLARFGHYFGSYWVGAMLALLMIVGGAYTQVTAPDLIGQAVDCYLFPQPASCWFTTASVNATADARVAGLLSLVAVLIGLFVGGSILQ